MTRMTRAGKSPLGWALLLGGWVLGGCGNPEVTEPGAGPAALAKAPGGGGKTLVTVTAADPDTVPIDTVLTVRITGSGFVRGDPNTTVTYLLDDKSSSEVKATVVEVLSATELTTTTTITKDALLGSYSIAVFTGGKRGVGAEKFEVVAKPVLLPEGNATESDAVDVNDAGLIVGYTNDGSSFHAVRWDLQGERWVATDLGLGTADAVNNRGEILVHRPADPVAPGGWAIPRAHVRLTSGPEVDLGIGAVGSGMSEDGTVVGLVSDGTPGGGTGVIWPRRSGEDSWDAPITIPAMSGYAQFQVSGISDNGKWIHGYVYNATGVIRGVVWTWDGKSVGGPRFVDPTHDLWMVLIGGVNSAGAIAGSVRPCDNQYNCVSHLAYWPLAGAPQQLMPFPDGGNGHFYGINDQGQMVGYGSVPIWSRKGKTLFAPNRPVLWAPGSAELIDLGSFRSPRDAIAEAINSGGRLVVGREQDGSGGTHAVAWVLP